MTPKVFAKQLAETQKSTSGGPKIHSGRVQNRAKIAQDVPRIPRSAPRASQERPKTPQERPKSAQERPKTAQEPPKRRPGDAQTFPKPAPERSRTSFSCAHGRKPCSRSCWADFCSFFASRARWPTCSDVRFVPLLPVFCRVRSIHGTVAREHAKAFKNLVK